ncbi:MAG: rod shape-determining protein MreD [Halothiobacillaceae bacterium]
MRPDLRMWLAVPLSLLLALVVELLPFPQYIAQLQPPWLLLVVLYWSILQPAILGMTGAWLMGLLLDTIQPSPLGTHAALFTLVVTPVLAQQRLLRTLPVTQQTVWIAGLVFLYEVGELWLGQWLSMGRVTADDFLPVISTLIVWPLLRVLLHRCERCLS